MEEKKYYYVYSYTDPRNNEIFYIGKGKNRRCYSHLHEVYNNKIPSKKSKTLAKFNRIKDILDSGSLPIIEKMFVDLNEHEAFEKENEMILKYKFLEDGGTLLNQVMNSKITNDLSVSISDSLKAFYSENPGTRKGAKTPEEVKVKQSLARKRFFENGGKNWCDGIKMSEDFCRANSEGQKKRFQKQRQHNALYWVTPEGIFPSKSLASLATGLTEGQIRIRCQIDNNLIPIHNKTKDEISEKYGQDKVGLTWREIGYYTQFGY